MPMPCPLHAAATSDGTSADGDVAAYLAASAERPSPAPSAAPSEVSADVQFPWGSVPVTAKVLLIGRDHGESCGAPIEEYTNVSREHAKIQYRDGRVIVEDHASTNGTTVNGQRIAPYQEHALADGDIVGFGARLRAVIAIRTATP
jgi:hypothetical protein